VRGVLLSTMLTLCGTFVPVAAQAVMQSYQLNIPRERLDAALKDFAQQTGLQIARFSDTPGGDAVVGPVTGAFSIDDALHSLLTASNLTYRFVNDRTIAVVSHASESSTEQSSDATIAAQVPVADPGGSRQEEGKTRSSDPFRVAQLAPGSAPNSSPVSDPSKSPQSSQASLEEVVVTAQKRSERLQDVPISMSVLSGRDLDTSTFQNASDVLNTVPGVTSVTSILGGMSLMTIRGVTTPTLFEGPPAIGYYIDGVPFGLVKSGFAPDPNIYDLQQIEVLRGPQGTLYGANALNGVVRVLTNDADLNNFDIKARVLDSVTDGGGNNYGGDMAVNVPIIDGKLGARVVAGYQDLGGWIDSPLKNDVNFTELSNLRLKVNAQPTDQLSIGLNWWHNHEFNGAPNEGEDNLKTPSIIDQSITQQFDTYGLKVGYEFPAVSLSSMTSDVDYLDHYREDLAPLFGTPSYADNRLQSHVFSEEV
jgi:outer membrane receptor protein involved in Fe transport